MCVWGGGGGFEKKDFPVLYVTIMYSSPFLVNQKSNMIIKFVLFNLFR